MPIKLNTQFVWTKKSTNLLFPLTNLLQKFYIFLSKFPWFQRHIFEKVKLIFSPKCRPYQTLITLMIDNFKDVFGRPLFYCTIIFKDEIPSVYVKKYRATNNYILDNIQHSNFPAQSGEFYRFNNFRWNTINLLESSQYEK